MNPFVLQYPDLDPVAFTVFGQPIYWYALTYILAFVIAYVLMRRRLHHEPFRSNTTPKPWVSEDVDDILFYSIIGVLLGGRLGYCFFYKPSYYLANPLEIITGIRDGGMSFHGGVIGVLIALAILAKLRGRPFLQYGDFLAPAVPLGFAAGRLGNFINGELWGREASESLPWAMIFPTGGDIPRHPSQLYQALLEGVLLFVILWLFARKWKPRGLVSGAFLLGYGTLRFIGEFFREPDAHLGILSLGMSMGQWLCVPMILAGAALMIWAQKAGIDDRGDPTADGEDEPSAASETSTTEPDGVGEEAEEIVAGESASPL
ncbi:phosphatidylglycerol:prolipoprotein diacylglycerol transferase [Ruaniaceae bacterium KH17]|nr:phosphatidylglycerol:prolipoprotein diacylglycerol transferase [Ruaniaceae bacterium KH17]